MVCTCPRRDRLVMVKSFQDQLAEFKRLSHPYIYHDFVLREIRLSKNMKVLDVGCGRGTWGYLFRTLENACTCSSSYIIGLDVNRDLLGFNRKYKVYDDLVLCDCTSLPFKHGIFDLVLGIEVIEHLTKHGGFRFLLEIERVSNAQGKVILTTPNGFWPQGPIDGHASEIHYSGWTVTEFRERNYKVHGVGFKPALFFKAGKVQAMLTYAFTPLAYMVPQIGFLLIANKHPVHKKVSHITKTGNPTVNAKNKKNKTIISRARNFLRFAYIRCTG